MGRFKIIEEKPITLNELKNKLNKIEKRDEELSFRGNKAKEYVSSFIKTKNKDDDSLKKKIEELNIPRLKSRQIIKIIDIHPKDLDSLKILLSGETITVKEEDLKKILTLL
ncbi:MAG: hypothetical protein U9Q69_03785 [Nanoarchaeota archaeon]|nr:hypothetical protein [Nanoarchaeota archaeon]